MGFGGCNSFAVFETVFFIAFFSILGVVVFAAIRGIAQWNKNNHSPRLTVPAAVVSKRTNVSSHMNNAGSGMHHTSRSTTYYITFEVESGDRMELQMNGSEFGMLAEGDVGMLTFQGTRYLGFERDRKIGSTTFGE
ncbi:MAG: DUF2500 domain-containing protein [Clostridia bacterium]|nr:DUF2500 domain-containing protein [Clostridia bacterium]